MHTSVCFKIVIKFKISTYFQHIEDLNSRTFPWLSRALNYFSKIKHFQGFLKHTMNPEVSHIYNSNDNHSTQKATACKQQKTCSQWSVKLYKYGNLHGSKLFDDDHRKQHRLQTESSLELFLSGANITLIHLQAQNPFYWQYHKPFSHTKTKPAPVLYNFSAITIAIILL